VASDARQRMIDGAVRLLAMRGLQATSFAEVLALTGAPRGSIYHHFPDGKDQLVASALEVARGRLVGLLEELRGAPPEEVTERFLGLWRLVLTRAEFRAGCAVVAVTVATDSPDLLARVGEIFRGWRAQLADLLAEGGLTGPNAAAFAATLVAASEGAVVLSRAERSTEPFDLVAGSLLAQVRALAKT
jgi:TetR/AcrR family transcriptional regulator, lmrAB and yxaGH operons repressor